MAVCLHLLSWLSLDGLVMSRNDLTVKVADEINYLVFDRVVWKKQKPE